MGKGSKRRPSRVARDAVAVSWDRIFDAATDKLFGGPLSAEERRLTAELAKVTAATLRYSHRTIDQVRGPSP